MKRWIVFLLSACMIVTLIACNSEGGKSSSDSKSSTVSVTSSQSDTEEEPEGTEDMIRGENYAFPLPNPKYMLHQ